MFAHLRHAHFLIYCCKLQVAPFKFGLDPHCQNIAQKSERHHLFPLIEKWNRIGYIFIDPAPQLSCFWLCWLLNHKEIWLKWRRFEACGVVSFSCGSFVLGFLLILRVPNMNPLWGCFKSCKGAGGSTPPLSISLCDLAIFVKRLSLVWC